MTECTQRSLPFSRLGEKKIYADFDHGRLTSDASAHLLRAVDKRLLLINSIADGFETLSQASLIQLSQREMFAQYIFAIPFGYEDFNACDSLRHNPP